MLPLLFLSFAILLLIGAPIAVCLGVSSVLAMLVQGAGRPIVTIMSSLPQLFAASTSKFVLLAIPFFILAGNIMEQMVAALKLARVVKNGRPKCIFGHTVKGKGVSYMENQCGWHGMAPNEEQYHIAMNELDTQYVDC